MSNKKNKKPKPSGALVSSAILWALVGVLAFFFLIDSPVKFYFAGRVSDNLSHFYDDASCLAAGNIPYSEGFSKCVAVHRNVPAEKATFEYPPAAAALFWAMGLAGRERGDFETVYVIVMLMMFASIFMMAWSEADALRERGGPDRRAAAFAAAAVASLSCGPVAVVSYDLVPAVLSAGALMLLLRNKPAWAGLLLGLSVMLKGYAVVLLPVFAFFSHRKGGTRGMLTGGAVFVAVCAAISLAAVAVSPEEFIKSFSYHSGRGLEYNSIYSGILILMKNYGAADIGRSFDHGSWNLTGAPADALAAASPFIMIAGLAAATLFGWLLARRTRPEQDSPGDGQYTAAVSWCAAVLIAFIVTFKVGSPQFLCWVAPFIVLLVLKKGTWPAVLMFALAGHASTEVFPWLWESYVVSFLPKGAAFVVFGRVCLLLLCVWLLWPEKTVSKKM